MLLKMTAFWFRVKYSGVPVMSPPDWANLTLETQQIILNKTNLDMRLYQHAQERFQELSRKILRQNMENELRDFRQVQTLLKDICHQNPDHPACIWYSLDDLQFFRLISGTRAEPVPFVFL